MWQDWKISWKLYLQMKIIAVQFWQFIMGIGCQYFQLNLLFITIVWYGHLSMTSSKGGSGSRRTKLHKIPSSTMDSSVILTVDSIASISLLWCFHSSVCSKQLQDQFSFRWPSYKGVQMREGWSQKRIRFKPVLHVTQQVSEAAQTYSSHKLFVHSPRRNSFFDKLRGKSGDYVINCLVESWDLSCESQ